MAQVIFFLLDRDTNDSVATPVTVQLGPFSATQIPGVNPPGAYFPNVPVPGQYAYTTSAQGWIQASGLLELDAAGNPTVTNASPQPATVTTNGAVGITIYLAPAGGGSTLGELDVAVMSAAGGPVVGAAVVISGPTVATGVTDALGGVAFPDIPAGTYAISVQAQGFQSTTVSATVPAGGQVSAPATLTPTTQPPPALQGSTSPWVIVGAAAGVLGVILLASRGQEPPRRRGATRG